MFILFTFSVLVDLVWLLGNYHPAPLSSSEADFSYENHSKTLDLVTHFILGIHSLCKMCLCWNFCKHTEVGDSFIFCLKKLLPTSLEEANPKRQLESRIITIAWLEVFSAIIFLSCAIYIMLRLSWAYNASTFLFDLPSIMLMKAGTVVLFFLGVMKNVGRISFLFQDLGCIPFTGINEDISRVKIDGEFLKFNSFLKVVDFLFGVATIFFLASSFVLGEDGIEEVRIVTLLVSLALFVNSVMSVALWSSVCWYSSIISNSEENEERVEENNSFGSLPQYQVRTSLKNVIENSASNVITNPLEFAMEWKQLAPGFRRGFQASYTPSNEICTNALEASGFQVVASGSVQKEIKIYCFTIVMGEQYLLELTFNPTLRCLEVQIKAKLSTKRLVVSSILSKLPLNELFGITHMSKHV